MPGTPLATPSTSRSRPKAWLQAKRASCGSAGPQPRLLPQLVSVLVGPLVSGPSFEQDGDPRGRYEGLPAVQAEVSERQHGVFSLWRSALGASGSADWHDHRRTLPD